MVDVHVSAPAKDGAPAPAERRSVLRTVAAVEAARAELDALPWTRLDPVPEFALAVVGVRPEVHGPYVERLTAPDGEDVVFVGRLEDVPLTVSAGYRTLYRPILRAITLVHGGVHGAETPGAANALVASLREELRAGGADVLLLPSIETGTPLHTAATAVPAALRSHFRRRSTHWSLRLPDSFDEFIRSRSRNTRDNIRLYGNRLRRDHGETLSWRVYREPGELEELVHVLEEVSGKTYQRGLGVPSPDSLEERTLMRFVLERGWYRAWVLSANDRPIAFWSGVGFHGTLFLRTTGYDPEFEKYSIGTYLLMRVIEDSIADHAIHTVDYSLGDSDYKRRFASDSWEEEDVLIFAPTFRGVRVNATRTALEGAVALGRGVAARTGLAARVKRRWRRRLARGATSPVG